VVWWIDINEEVLPASQQYVDLPPKVFRPIAFSRKENHVHAI